MEDLTALKLRACRGALARALRAGLLASSGVLVLAALSACGDPVPDAEIEALGPEDPAVPVSDIHRPGQPCLLCHGPYKGAQPEMTVAGTIYGYPSNGSDGDEPIPVENVLIELSDSFGTTPPNPPKTNCAGNFYLTRDDWNPSFPIRVAIRYPVGADGTERVSMGTRISRDGSCAGCHTGKANQGTPGWVFCTQSKAETNFEAPESCAPGGGN